MSKVRLFWRIFTTVACVLTLAFIFSNSLKTAEVSSSQSSRVVDTVQKVVAIFAPDSSIATATGEVYEKLHAQIRTLAHFLQFALLGALYCWCWFTYTDEKGYVVIPATAIVITPMVDELLQALSYGRATEWLDVGVDVAGGIVGGIFALCTITIGACIYRKRKQKTQSVQATAAQKA